MSDTLTCYRHANEEVFLRCGKCERPICEKCTVHGPAGARCRECSSMQDTPLYQVDGGKMATGGAVGIASSFLLGYLLAMASPFGFFQLWGGLIFGGIVGEALLRATGRRRGVKIEVLTFLSTLVGLGASAAIWYFRVIAPTMDLAATPERMLQPYLFYILSFFIMLFSAVSRVRFF